MNLSVEVLVALIIMLVSIVLGVVRRSEVYALIAILAALHVLF